MKKCKIRNVIFVGFIYLLLTVIGALAVNQIHKERNRDYNDPAYFVKYTGGYRSDK